MNARLRELMAERDAVRKAKNWAESDNLRNKIESMGYTVGDSPTGTTVKKKHKKVHSESGQIRAPATSSQSPPNMSDDPNRKVSY